MQRSWRCVLARMLSKCECHLKVFLNTGAFLQGCFTFPFLPEPSRETLISEPSVHLCVCANEILRQQHHTHTSAVTAPQNSFVHCTMFTFNFPCILEA